MHAQSFNFDPGVKNYKKNRLILNDTHLKNEILYNIDRTSKPTFTISALSYVFPNSERPSSFQQIKSDLESSGFDNPFHFYINRKGNIITHVELSAESRFSSNIVFCLASPIRHALNNNNAADIYEYVQLNTLERVLNVFKHTAKNVSYENLIIDNNTPKMSNAGFDLKSFVEERGINGV